MRLVDIDTLKTLDCSGLAYIAPNNFPKIAEYFKKQFDSLPTIDAMTKSDEKLLGEMLDQLSVRLELINDIAIEWLENASIEENLEFQKKMFEIEAISKMEGQKNSEKEVAISVPIISEVMDDFEKIFEEEKRIIGRKELLSEIKPV